MIGLWRARCTPVCIVVLGSPADLLATAFQGFRREARLTPGYARTAFQAELPGQRCITREGPYITQGLYLVIGKGRGSES